MPRQLSFDLPARPALGRDDFFVSPSNALAVAMVGDMNTWTARKLVLSGPEGSGKTHLTHVWATQTGAPILCATDLGAQDIPSLANGPVAIEDVPEIATDQPAQEALFHLHNLMQVNGHPLLLTGRPAPNLWQLSLPDLQSRIQGAQHAILPPPDDTLLAAILAKLFADRQVTPRPDVIPYLVAHIDRSFEAAARVVEQLDHAALAEKRSLTRALAVRLLGAGADNG
jgi:chromosomal replication initiation ATPase DnaA